MKAFANRAPVRASRQRGFAIIAALFLLVVLGGVGLYIASASGVQHATTALSVQGARAELAARSGIEWAISDIVNNAAGGLDCASGTTGLTFSEGALAGFAVTVSCTALPVTEGARNYTVYSLDATAFLGAATRPDFVQRRLQASVAI